MTYYNLQTYVRYRGKLLVVDYNKIPGEKEVRYTGNGDGYPGSPEILEINAIFYDGVDVTGFLNPVMDDIEKLLYEQNWEVI